MLQFTKCSLTKWCFFHWTQQMQLFLICAKLRERDNYSLRKDLSLSLENDRKAAWKPSSCNAQIKKREYIHIREWRCICVLVTQRIEWAKQAWNKQRRSKGNRQVLMRCAANHRIYDTFRYSQSIQKLCQLRQPHTHSMYIDYVILLIRTHWRTHKNTHAHTDAINTWRRLCHRHAVKKSINAFRF